MIIIINKNIRFVFLTEKKNDRKPIPPVTTLLQGQTLSTIFTPYTCRI